MSRNIKDLRELICMSRLSYRPSDSSDSDPSNNDSDEPMSPVRMRDSGFRPPSPVGLKTESVRRRLDRTHLTRNATSSIPQNGNSRTYSSSSSSSSRAPSRASSSRKKNRKKRRGQHASTERRGQHASTESSVGAAGEGVKVHPPYKDLSHFQPLPKISTSQNTAVIAGITGEMTDQAIESSLHAEQPAASVQRFDFAEVLVFANSAVISDWLLRAQTQMDSLSTWAYTGENYVRFCQFWLNNFPPDRRREILNLERDILLDEFAAAFQAGLESGRISHSDLSALLKALFREYPTKLFPSGSTRGATADLFLDYLDIFTSAERSDAYRRVLADVKLSTRHKEHAQTALAARLFALVSVWSSVVNFHTQISELESRGATPAPGLPHHHTDGDNAGSKEVLKDRCYHRLSDAIRLGYVETVHFFLNSECVSAAHIDCSGRTLVLHAVACNQPTVLTYLLKKWRSKIDVNKACDTGNTALHVAANLGSLELTRILLGEQGLDMDPTNLNCEGATPLHLAVMYGHADITQALINAGANVHALMGELPPLTIATDFDQGEVAALLRQHQ